MHACTILCAMSQILWLLTIAKALLQQSCSKLSAFKKSLFSAHKLTIESVHCFDFHSLCTSFSLLFLLMKSWTHVRFSLHRLHLRTNRGSALMVHECKFSSNPHQYSESIKCRTHAWRKYWITTEFRSSGLYCFTKCSAVACPFFSARRFLPVCIVCCCFCVGAVYFGFGGSRTAPRFLRAPRARVLHIHMCAEMLNAALLTQTTTTPALSACCSGVRELISLLDFKVKKNQSSGGSHAGRAKK